MWVFIGVYDPTLKRSREFFREELGAIRGLWNGPWCIRGDFHVTRFPSECSRGGRIALAMRKFSKLIDELDLRDLFFQGGLFTWNGGLNGQSMSRLDYSLVFEDREGHFSGVV